MIRGHTACSRIALHELQIDDAACGPVVEGRLEHRAIPSRPLGVVVDVRDSLGTGTEVADRPVVGVSAAGPGLPHRGTRPGRRTLRPPRRARSSCRRRHRHDAEDDDDRGRERRAQVSDVGGAARRVPGRSRCCGGSTESVAHRRRAPTPSARCAAPHDASPGQGATLRWPNSGGQTQVAELRWPNSGGQTRWTVRPRRVRTSTSLRGSVRCTPPSPCRRPRRPARPRMVGGRRRRCRSEIRRAGRARRPCHASSALECPTANPTVRDAMSSASVWSMLSGHTQA